MTKRFFITSSGTGIGKTLVTASLVYQLRNAGFGVDVKKPIISGWGDAEKNGDESDVSVLLEASGLEFTHQNIDKISKFRLKEPLSPNMAAKIEGKELNLNEIFDACEAKNNIDIQLIEGVGGVMVPLNNQHTILDLMDGLQIPAILVVGSYLGSISHALTAIATIRSRNLQLHGIIISESEDSIDVSTDEIKTTISNFDEAPITIIPRLSGDNIWQQAPDILKVIGNV